MTQNQHNIRYAVYGEQGATPILWAHGWGQSHKSFEPLISSVERLGRHIAVDFPGFGDSPAPPEAWGTAEYADAVADFMREYIDGKVIWVGHSFGCRVGLQMAARHPNLIAGLFLIAGAGLKRKRPPVQAAYMKARVMTYKVLKGMIPLGVVNEEWLKTKFGSVDYRNAGEAMRGVLIKTINEDLVDVAAKITCPVHLVYGEKDTETPVEIGQRLNALIPGSVLTVLPDQDHYSVLGQGRHQVAPLLKTFIETTVKQP